MIRCELESSEVNCEWLLVHRARAREQMSQLYELNIDVVLAEEVAGEDAPDADDIVGCSMVLHVYYQQQGLVAAPERRFHGVVCEVREQWDAARSRRCYQLKVVPRLWQLTQVATMAAFVGSSIIDVINDKLEMYKLSGDRALSQRLTAEYGKREFIVQYDESDFSFISRLCENMGIGYFFQHEEDSDVLVMTDDNSGFVPVPEVAAEDAELDAAANSLGIGNTWGVGNCSIERVRRLVPSTHIVNDFNAQLPALNLVGRHKESGDSGGVYRYGDHIKTPHESQQMAVIRAQEQTCLKNVYHGESARISFSPGYWFTVNDHPLHNGDYLLIEVEHEMVQAVPHFEHDDQPAYRNRFRAIPVAQPYRPPRLTPRPKISGIIHGIVETSQGVAHGQHAELDDDGRYCVRLMFDVSADEAQPPSHRIRRIQALAGANYGVHMPLRPGTEVAVAFVDGDPDRPIILGAVPNALTPSPVSGQEANKSRIRTASGILLEMVDS